MSLPGADTISCVLGAGSYKLTYFAICGQRKLFGFSQKNCLTRLPIYRAVHGVVIHPQAERRDPPRRPQMPNGKKPLFPAQLAVKALKSLELRERRTQRQTARRTGTLRIFSSSLQVSRVTDFVLSRLSQALENLRSKFGQAAMTPFFVAGFIRDERAPRAAMRTTQSLGSNHPSERIGIVEHKTSLINFKLCRKIAEQSLIAIAMIRR